MSGDETPEVEFRGPVLLTNKVPASGGTCDVCGGAWSSLGLDHHVRHVHALHDRVEALEARLAALEAK